VILGDGLDDDVAGAECVELRDDAGVADLLRSALRGLVATRPDHHLMMVRRCTR
jgi:hypothetical protein